MSRYFVTGCAGFIGSNLVDRLLADGNEVVGHDNLSTGRRQFIARARQSAAFTFIEGDLLDAEGLSAALRRHPVEQVFHLAANADISPGWSIRAAISSRIRSPPSTCSSRCARRGARDRLFLDRVGGASPSPIRRRTCASAAPSKPLCARSG